MRRLHLLLLLIPFIAVEEGLSQRPHLDCPSSPRNMAQVHTCYYQYYWTIGNNFNCYVNFVGPASFLSMEITNIGKGDSVTVVSHNFSIRSNSSSLSIQQYFQSSADSIVSITVTSSNKSKMSGIFFLCPTKGQFKPKSSNYGCYLLNSSLIPVTQVNISSGQEGLILQRISANNEKGSNPPGKWEITAESQVALIAAANITYCPMETCMEMIWAYEGIGEDAIFIGTAADFKNSLYLSKGKTMTLYYVSSGVQQRDVLDATYYMAVIANEAKNLEKCSKFDVVFYPQNRQDRYYVTMNTTGEPDTGGACSRLVVNDCAGMYLWNGAQRSNIDFYVYARAPHSDPFGAGLILQQFSRLTMSKLLPQTFPGTARTFYLAPGSPFLDNSAVLTFGEVVGSTQPDIGRQGFLMTNFYPFNSSDMGVVPLNFFNTDAPSGWEASSSLSIYVDDVAVQNMNFDVNTNVGIPMTVYVKKGSTSEVFFDGGQGPNRGTFVTYFIGEGVPTTATPSTIATRTTTSTTTTTTTTTGTPTTTTTRRTNRPTDPPENPKSTADVFLLVAIVFPMVLSLF